MKRCLVWFFMLWKRLLLKKGFLLILALIPIAALLLSISAREETGLMNISVAVEGEADETAGRFLGRLEGQSGAFHFTVCDTPDRAKNMLTSGETDSAWIIPGNIGELIARRAKGESVKLVDIYQREENVFLKLSREKIFCTLYGDISYSLYREYMTGKFMPEYGLSEEELAEAYRIYATDETLIDFRYIDSAEAAEEINYLTAPIKGFLAVLMLLCGLASTMYFLTDEEEKTFSLLPARRRVWVMAGGNLSALLTAGTVVYLALWVSEGLGDPVAEALSMLTFILCACGFCTLLGSSLRDIKLLGLLAPVVLVVCMVFCPIFFTMRGMLWLQMLLPPYHYLVSGYSGIHILYMLIYMLVQ